MSLLDYSQLSQAVQARRSIRAYDGDPLSDQEIRLIKLICDESRGQLAGARVEVVLGQCNGLFTGLAIKNAPACLLMIGDLREPGVEEAVGFAGEHVILSATSMGLGTCWVTATYRPEVAAGMAPLGTGERVFAVSPLGHSGRTGLVESVFNQYVTKSRDRRPLPALLTPGSLSPGAAPEWVRVAVEAARLAPSAYNRQPWRFTTGEDFVKISVDPGTREVQGASRRIDCGMAMAHVEIAARAAGITGRWELLDDPDVACYRAE